MERRSDTGRARGSVRFSSVISVEATDRYNHDQDYPPHNEGH
jgi:hypothetical protein